MRQRWYFLRHPLLPRSSSFWRQKDSVTSRLKSLNGIPESNTGSNPRLWDTSQRWGIALFYCPHVIIFVSCVISHIMLKSSLLWGRWVFFFFFFLSNFKMKTGEWTKNTIRWNWKIFSTKARVFGSVCISLIKQIFWHWLCHTTRTWFMLANLYYCTHQTHPGTLAVSL